MRKKGFTLIELLAVIVVLAIIALIATPLIMNVIDEAKVGAAISSGYEYIRTVELEAVNNMANGSSKLNGTYTTKDADLYDSSNNLVLDIEMKGQKPEDGGTIIISNNIVVSGSKITIGNYELNYDGKELTQGDVVVDDDDDNVIVTGNPLATALVNQAGTSTTTTEGFKDNGDGTYTYTGASGTGGTNWLWYGGHLWRIMTLDTSDNSMELITSYSVTAIHWGDTVSNMPSLESSYVGKWLNEVFLESLPINVQNALNTMTYTRKVYNGNSVVSEEKSGVKVRLLTEAEYTSYGDADKYLDIKDYYWLSDIYSDSNVRRVDNSGNLRSSGPVSAYGVRPAVEVSGITFTEGVGTLTSPYVVGGTIATTTSTIAIGEYVSVPKNDGSTYLARVVKQDSNGTKVVLNGLYAAGKFGSSVTFSKNSSIYTGNLTTFKGTLDTTYFDNNDKNFNITQYGAGNDYSLSTSTVSTDIGLPSVGEMFSGNDIDLSTSSTKTFVDSTKLLNPTLHNYYWLMNSYSDSGVRYVRNYGSLSNYDPADEYGVRPTWYITSGSITGGSGTPASPYLLK